MNWFPCTDCARAIIQAGITEVVGAHYDPTHERWGKSFITAMEMLTEAGVRVTIR